MAVPGVAFYVTSRLRVVRLLPRGVFFLYTPSMTLESLEDWFRSTIPMQAFSGIDDSLNGLQVGRHGPDEISRVAFAVDACADSIERAAAWGAQALFVHHGLFWGKPQRIQGTMLKRLHALFAADMALFACHLPLDAHPELGNNAVLAGMLGIMDPSPFGIYHGVPIGYSGILASPISMEVAVSRILPSGERPRTMIAAGSPLIRKVAVVSGGAPFEVLQALEAKCDLYVTGESSHSIYHSVVEGGINFIAAGHYATEVWGVRAVARKLSGQTGIKTSFIELPTGL